MARTPWVRIGGPDQPLYAPGGIVGTMPSGTTYYVDSVAGNNGNDGRSWQAAKATLRNAYATAAAGDTIYVAEGHAENLLTVLTLAKAGLRIIGEGEGARRPAFTVTGAVDGLSITAADVLVENIRFVTPSAAATADINIASDRAVVRGVGFALGANAVNPVTITAAGELPTIEDCDVIVTANGPDVWIRFEGVVDRPIIRRNVVIGSDGTNTFDDGVIDFNGVTGAAGTSYAVTNPMVYENIFDGGNVATTVIANGGNVVAAVYGSNTYAGSATDADNTSSGMGPIIDQLSGADGITTFPVAAIPANGVSLAKVIRQIYAALEGTAAGQNGVATWPASAAPGNNVSIAEVLGWINDALQGANGVVSWLAAAAPGDGVSLAEAVRYIVETQLGTLTNTGGTATLGGILGDVSNVSVATSLAKLGTLVNTGGTATLGGILGDVANVTVAASLAKLGTLVNTGGTATLGGILGDVANVDVATSLAKLGTLVNTGGTATLGGILGDLANSSLVTRLNLIQGQTPATYVPGLGFRVAKVENTNAAGDDLFTVTGKVMITCLTGEVTNALGGGVVADYILRIKTSNEPLCAASTISSDVLGTMYALSGDVGDTLNGGSTPTTRVADVNGKGPVQLVVGLAGGSDVIQSIHTDTGDIGDAITWTLFYLPLEASASVAAAA